MSKVVVSTSLLSCYPWSSSLALAMGLASSGMTFNLAMRAAALRVDMEDAWCLGLPLLLEVTTHFNEGLGL